MKTQYTLRTGFKVCYKERGKKQYIRHFLSRNYISAISMINYYKRYPQNSRENNHKLKKPKWKIIPVSIKEVHAGIWREVPF